MNSLRAIRTLAMLDLRLWLASPSALVSALLPPLGMALLLAVLALSVTEQPVALVVDAHGPYALRMEKLIRADSEAYALRNTDAATAEHLLESQEVAAIITIPADFDHKADNHDAALSLKLNNVDIDFADDIRRSVERSAGQFDAPNLGLQDRPDTDAAKEADTGKPGETGEKPDSADGEKETGTKPAAGETDADDEAADKTPAAYVYEPDPDGNPYHILVEEHDLRVTKVDFLHYQLVPALVLLVLNIGMTGTALLCARDGERGTARLLVLAPVSAWALVTGRLMGGFLASLAVLIPVIAACMATHTIVVPENHGTALVALFCVIALCASGLGAGLGTALRGSRNVAMASSILATYLFLMGGGFTTIAFLPPWLRTLSALDPMRYAVDGLREALFYPTLSGFAADLTVLTGTALAATLLGTAMVVHSWRR